MTEALSIGEITGIYEDKSREEALEAYRITIEANKGNEEKLNELAFLAADYAHSEALALLFEAGVSPQITDKDECNLLHHLCRQYRRKFPSKPNPKGAAAQTASLLLDNKVSALRKDVRENLCPYHYAAQKGLREMVEIMVERGVKLNMTDKNGDTGIHIAANHAGEALKNLERKKVRMEQEPLKFEKNNALLKQNYYTQFSEQLKKIREETQRDYEAAIQLYEDYLLVIKVFAANGVDIDEKNAKGKTALDIAVKNDAKKIAAFLSGNLTDEAGSTAADNSDAIAAGGMTLHKAAEKGDAEAIKAIAKTGVDLNSLADGCTALAIACAYLHTEAVETLLACGADPSFKDSKGLTAASYLADKTDYRHHRNDKEFNTEKRIPGILKNMISVGLDINQLVDDDGNTLLTFACKRLVNYTIEGRRTARNDILAEILKNNPNLNLANRFGETALMFACIGDFEIMEKHQLFFLEQGADVSAADKNGDTALHYAARNKNKAGAKTLCDMLLEFDADVKAVNNAGRTALDIATGQDNEPLVKLLLSKM